jgi:hypothetical protein
MSDKNPSLQNRRKGVIDSIRLLSHKLQAAGYVIEPMPLQPNYLAARKQEHRCRQRKT